MADNSVQNGTDTIATDEVTTLNGSASSSVKVQRVKVMFGDDATARDASASFPLPIHMRNDSRTFVHYFAVAAAAGTTGTETAITLTKSPSAGSATSTGASFTPTSGKRFRISSISFATRGHATATIQTTTFSLRVNTAGATTTTSNVWFQARSATPATASAWDRYAIVFGDEGPELVGDGTLTFGVTAAATYTTNAPTWDVVITGYEY